MHRCAECSKRRSYRYVCSVELTAERGREPNPYSPLAAFDDEGVAFVP
jgi:hypothetical protein